MPGSPSLVGRAPGNGNHKARSRKGTGVQISLPAPYPIMERCYEQDLPPQARVRILLVRKNKNTLTGITQRKGHYSLKTICWQYEGHEKINAAVQVCQVLNSSY